MLEGLEVRITLALQQDARLAVQLGREALHLAGTLDSPGSVARAESLLGAALYICAEYAEAEAILVRALGVCDRLADVSGQRRCLCYLGYLTHASGRHAEAIVYFLRLMALAQHSDSARPDGSHPDSALSPEDAQRHRAEAHGGLSMVYSDLGDTASSLEHQLEALALQRQQADRGGLGMALSNISVDYRDLGQLDLSAQYCREALEIARAAGDVRTETAALSNLGLTCLAQGRTQEAAPLFERLLRLARRAGLTRRVMWGLQGMAELHLAAGHPELALPHLYEALSVSQEGALRSEEIETWLLIGRSQLEDKGQAPSAVASLERALHLAQETRNLQAESRVRLALSGAHEQAAEPVQALLQLRAYLALKDERESALTEQRAQVLAVRFGAEESRRENERLVAHARQMEESAHQDALTGLLNRRGLEPRLEAALARAQTLGTGLCLAVLDLDHFKQVNDRYSHQVGDEVLRAAAGLFLAGCRSSDGVGRYGGEEFLILLPDTALEAAATLLERLRRRVQDHPWNQLRPGLSVTVSIGVAQLGVDTPSVAALVAAADARLYAAKTAGRNRVVAA